MSTALPLSWCASFSTLLHTSSSPSARHHPGVAAHAEVGVDLSFFSFRRPFLITIYSDCQDRLNSRMLVRRIARFSFYDTFLRQLPRHVTALARSHSVRSSLIEFSARRVPVFSSKRIKPVFLIVFHGFVEPRARRGQWLFWTNL